MIIATHEPQEGSSWYFMEGRTRRPCRQHDDYEYDFQKHAHNPRKDLESKAHNLVPYATHGTVMTRLGESAFWIFTGSMKLFNRLADVSPRMSVQDLH